MPPKVLDGLWPPLSRTPAAEALNGPTPAATRITGPRRGALLPRSKGGATRSAIVVLVDETAEKVGRLMAAGSVRSEP